MTASETLRCESTIERVQLYARGAQVTRWVNLPVGSLPSAATVLALDNLSPLAKLGSIRVAAEGGRQVVGLDADMVLPARIDAAQGLRARVQSLRLEVSAAEVQQQNLRRQRELLGSARPDLGLRPRRPSMRADERFSDAFATSRLLDALCSDLDGQLRAIGVELADLRRALEAAQLAFHQASKTDDAAPSDLPPRVGIQIKLAPGDEPLTALRVTYEVPAARWWPAYTVRLDTRTNAARITLEAFIVQDTFEDWPDVALELITADLSREIALPTLASLRLGRPRPPKRTGLRAPPEGLELLFHSFDALANTSPAVLAQVQDILARPEPSDAHGYAPDAADYNMPEEAEEKSKKADYYQSAREQAPPSPKPSAFSNPYLTDNPMTQAAMLPPMSARKGGGVLSAIGGAVGAVVAAPVILAGAAVKAASAKKSPQRRLMSESSSMTRAGTFGARDEMPYDLDEGGFGGGGPGADIDQLPAELELDERWLNFDLLVLARFNATERRGRLTHKPQTALPPAVRFAQSRLDAIDNPPGTLDPIHHRGEFDHRYQALGKTEIPADGRPHRVPISTAEGLYKTRFRSVPAELDQVFRLVDVPNPFDAPLLPGPADIFIDGALVITSQLAKTDKGGSFALGLGVEDRLRVARNVRTQEHRRGLLKGTTHIENTIQMEVTSSLPMAARLEVIDRIPVSDATDLTLAVLAASPEPEVYAQDELGQPVRGGRRWTLHLAPGSTAEITLTYAIELPSKLDIIGGSHRE